MGIQPLKTDLYYLATAIKPVAVLKAGCPRNTRRAYRIFTTQVGRVAVTDQHQTANGQQQAANK